MSKSPYIEEDTANKKENYGTFTSTSTYGVMMVEDHPIIEEYSKWTVKVLNHPKTGKICIGVMEMEKA